MYVCEKLEGIPSCKVGEVESGFDAERILALSQRVEEMDWQCCRDCWMVHMCPLCWFHVIDKEGPSLKRREYYCKAIQSTTLKALSYYAEAMEHHSNSFRELLNKRGTSPT